MVTLLVGVLVVVVGAVGFGIALFGPRPVPKPATELADAPSPTEQTPSPRALPPRAAAATVGPLMPTPRTRARAVLWLVLAVLGSAALVGTLLGTVLVVLTTLVG